MPRIERLAAAFNRLVTAINVIEGRALPPLFAQERNVISAQIATETVATGDASGTIAALRTLRCNAVNVPVRVNFASTTDSAPVVDNAALANAEVFIKAIRAALNIQITIEPYPWIANGTQVETSYNPSAPATFFTNWRTALTTVAGLANKYGCDGMYVCSALEPTEQYETDWNTTIDYLATLYPGAIMFRTRWWVRISQNAVTQGYFSQADKDLYDAKYATKLNHSFWANKNLHIISFQGYWELTQTASPTLAQIKTALRNTDVYGRGQDVYADVKAFYSTWGKPLLFGELGCAATVYGALQPWSLTPNGDATPSSTTQANFFQAYLDTFGPEPWWMGFSIWQLSYPNLYYPVGTPTEAVINAVSASPDPRPESLVLINPRAATWLAVNAAAPTVQGMAALTATGTGTNRTVTTSSYFTRSIRYGYVSAATAGSLAGARVPTAQVTLGVPAAGAALAYGGFKVKFTFGVSDPALVSVSRMFLGLSASAAAPTNVEPSTLVNVIGIGNNSTDSNLCIYYGGSAAQARIDLGANFPTDTLSTDMYEVEFSCDAGVNNLVSYSVKRLNTGHFVAGTLTAATPGTQLPANTTLLTPLQAWRSNNTAAAAVALDLVSFGFRPGAF